jgi:iron complex transport system substrate-binding protein
MSLIPPSGSAAGGGSGVPLAWVVVIVLIAAGSAVAVTAVALAPKAPSGSVRITDDLDRTVAVPYDPSRVVAIGGSVVDLLFDLGLRGHLVGVDCYAAADGGLEDDYSSDQITEWNLSSSMCVQVAPELVPATLVNLTPNLILASTIVSVAAVEELSAEVGVPVVFLQPATVSGVLIDATDVGAIFGVEAAAVALNQRLTSELYNATNATASAVSFPTVLLTYSVDSDGYWTFGQQTFGASLLSLTGAISIAAGDPVPYPELTPAQVLSAQPQWIVYATGYGYTEATYEAGVDWSDFHAVQNGNLTGVDSNWLTEPGPTMILDGIPALLHVFQPTA